MNCADWWHKVKQASWISIYLLIEQSVTSGLLFFFFIIIMLYTWGVLAQLFTCQNLILYVSKSWWKIHLSQFSWENLLQQVNPVNCQALVSAVACIIFSKECSFSCFLSLPLQHRCIHWLEGLSFFLCTYARVWSKF